VRPTGQALAGEVGLVTAFLQQIISDTRSEKEPLRTEAVHVLRDDTAVRLWCSLVGVDDEAFRARAQRLRASRVAPAARIRAQRGLGFGEQGRDVYPDFVRHLLGLQA